MKKTNAERIFEDTRWECRKHIARHGFERNPDGQAVGFIGLTTDDESVSIRTLNAVQKFINAELEVLEMVQATLNNERQNYMF